MTVGSQPKSGKEYKKVNDEYCVMSCKVNSSHFKVLIINTLHQDVTSDEFPEKLFHYLLNHIKRTTAGMAPAKAETLHGYAYAFVSKL